jgi:hypothetical protein
MIHTALYLNNWNKVAAHMHDQGYVLPDFKDLKDYINRYRFFFISPSNGVSARVLGGKQAP